MDNEKPCIAVFKCSYCQKQFNDHELAKSHELDHYFKFELSGLSSQLEIESDLFSTKNESANTNDFSSVATEIVPSCLIGDSEQEDIVEVQVNYIDQEYPKSKCEEILKCSVCFQTFDNEHDLKEHICNMLQNNLKGFKCTYACDLCGCIFDEKGPLRDHLVNHHNKGPDFNVTPIYTCDRCGRTFNRRFNVIRHVAGKQACPNKPTEEPELFDDTNIFICTHCANEYHNKFDLECHMKTIHGESVATEIVPSCLIGNSEQEDIVEVQVKYIDQKYPKSKCDEILKCLVCFRRFYNEHDLKEHICNMPLNNLEAFKCTYACDLCDCIFDEKGPLRDHLLNLHNKGADFKVTPLYTCDRCGRTFNRRFNVIRHVAGKKACLNKPTEEPESFNDTNTNIFVCIHCANEYDDKFDLECHMKTIHVKDYMSSKEIAARRINVYVDIFTCEYCRRNFDRKGSLVLHMKMAHLKQNNYTSAYLTGHGCDSCDAVFISPSDFLYHRKIKHNAEELNWLMYNESVCLISLCGVCKTYYGRGSKHECKYQVLEDVFPVEKDFFCDICGLRYGWKLELRSHRETVHPDAPVWDDLLNIDTPACVCIECDKAFGNNEAFSNHKCTKVTRDTENVAKPFSCNICGRNFRNSSSYMRHLHKAHIQCIITRQTTPRKYNLAGLECVHCHKQLYSSSNMINHLKEKHDIITKSPFGCKICQKMFTNQDSFITHTKVYHPSDENTQAILNSASLIINGQLSYHCDKCNRNINESEAFLIHYRYHNLEKKFACQHCGKQCRTKFQLAKHINCTHLNIKKYGCDFCGKAFGTKQDRDSHRRIHTGERPFSCETCGKTFISMTRLFSHRRVHNDYYPHACMYCPKKFKIRRLLTNHIRTHTGERPYQCEICSKTFNNSSRYSYHVRVTHSDNRPFVCPLCGSCFKTNKFLKRHVQLHSEREHIQVRRRNNPALFYALHNLKKVRPDKVPDFENLL